MLKKLSQVVIAGAMVFGFAQQSNAAHLSGQLTFSARLDGAQEVPAVATDAAGVASMILTPNRDSLCMNLFTGGFDSQVTAIHLHNAAAGQNGGVVVDLTPFLSNNIVKVVLTGTLLPATLIEQMLSGEIYFNVHTIEQPDGEIRGQVKLETDFAYRSVLNGMQEVPATSTMATGVGNFNLSLNKTKLEFNIVSEGLSGAITGAHIHLAPAGTNGGVAVDLTSFIDGNSINGTVDVAGMAEFLDSLENGSAYINIHTAAEPNGEIRGQLSLDEGIAFDAVCDTAQEVDPVVNSNAKGAASFSLSNDMTRINYTVQVEGMSGPIMGAHLHEGSAGTAGGVLVDLSGDVNGNVISGTITGAALTSDLIKEMLESNVYLNIHTADNPNGEVRGQIGRLAREGYTINLSGDQEVPAVSTNASGGGIFTISRTRDNAHIMVVAKDLSGDISGAHLHNAAFGSNGGVLFDLTGMFNGDASFSSAFGYLTSDDATPFNANAEVLVRNEETYLNIHNAMFMDGELRGQLLRGSECTTTTALGINEETAFETVSLYPNPAANELTIVGNTGLVRVVSISGQVVLTANTSEEVSTLNISALQPGVYFVQTESGATQKFMKK